MKSWRPILITWTLAVLSVVMSPGSISGGLKIRTVVHVVDGDTVRLDDGERVRLLGIDTPERGDKLYAQAGDYLKALVLNRKVGLEFDHTRRDPYRRLLSHLWIGDTLVNELMVASGLARLYIWPPDTLHFARLLAAQTKARSTRLGVWSIVHAADESVYVIHPKRLRFHRTSCRNAPRIGLRRPLRSILLDSGYSACRTCKP